MLEVFGATKGPSTLAITVYTFCVIFFRWTPSRSKLVPICVVSMTWLYTTCFVAIGLTMHKGKGGKDSFYIPTPYWCWVYDSTPVRVFSDYLWYNFTALGSIILYIPLFFTIRGHIDVLPDGGKWYHYKVTFIRRPNAERRETDFVVCPGNPSPSDKCRSAAIKMLWYPAVQILVALSADISRWKFIQNIDPNLPLKDVPFTSIAVPRIIFGMCGVVDVVLFALTRPSILLFGEPAPQYHTRDSGDLIPRRGARGNTAASDLEPS